MSQAPAASGSLRLHVSQQARRCPGCIDRLTGTGCVPPEVQIAGDIGEGSRWQSVSAGATRGGGPTTPSCVRADRELPTAAGSADPELTQVFNSRDCLVWQLETGLQGRSDPGQLAIVKAADALNLSKTAVSRLVSDLENRVGTRLLQRTTRRLSLTQEGEVFLERCKALLDDLEEAEAAINAHTGEVIGQLRVNVPVTFGLMHIAPLWPRFMELHPKVTLEVSLADRLVDLVEEGYDSAVRIARLTSSSLVGRQIATTRMVLCASPEYLRRQGTPAHPCEIADHPVMSYTLLATGDRWEFKGPEGAVSVKVQPRMRTNSGDTCCAAALGHLGRVLQPSFLVGEHLASGRLVEVLPQYRSIELGVYALYPSRKHVTPKVRAFIDFLVDAFRAPGWPP